MFSGPLIRERSAGAIVFSMENRRLSFLLLHYPAGHWDFPKGNVEKDETYEQTALREIREETGIEKVETLPGFQRTIHYHYRRGSDLVSKEVIFFLVKAKMQPIKISREHLGSEWLSYEGSLKRVTYRNARSVLREARSFLDSRGHSPVQ